MIGSVTGEAEARRLGDHLLAVGIDNHVERSSNGASWLVWIERDDDLERAKGELESFQRNPADERYGKAEREAQRLRTEREAKQRRLARNYRDIRGGWAIQRAPAPGPVTLAIIAFCAIVFGSSFLGMNHEKLNGLFIQPVEWDAQGEPVLRPGLAAVKQGEVWRLVTPILIHYGVLHFLFNMMWMYQLGSLIEDRKGGLMLVVLVLAAAVPSNVLQFMHSGPFFGGMSGVVYALIGYVWMKGKFQPEDGMSLDRTSIMIAMVWLVLCMTVLKNIANTAHVVGLVIGLAFGAAPWAWGRVRRGR